MKKENLRLFEAFSGTGMQRRGIENCGLFEVESVGTSDLDKDAVLSYAVMHCGLTNELVDGYSEYPDVDEMADGLNAKHIGYDFVKKKEYDWHRYKKRNGGKYIRKYWLADRLGRNYGDICRIEELPECDMLTFSFPCQSISIAGRREGIVKGETRSGLVYEIIRLVETGKGKGKLPSFMLLENVDALVGKKFIKDFENLNDFFDGVGYSVYWSLLNAKDCGVPQNRRRVFALYIRKDVGNGSFEFPKPFDNGIRLKDVLDDGVDEKYYISDEKVRKFLENIEIDHKVSTRLSDIASCIRASYYKNGERNIIENIKNGNGYEGIIEPCGEKSENNVKRIGNLYGSQYGTSYAGNVYDGNGVSPTLMTAQGGGRQPHVLTCLVKDQWTRFSRTTDVSNALLARDYKGFGNQESTAVCELESVMFRIRRLTPKECFVLMGLEKEDCEKDMEIGISNSSLYKIAGNGIVTNCVELIAEHLYKAQYDPSYQCRDEDFYSKTDDVENDSQNELVMLGGVGEKNFGNSYRPGNRVYDSEGIAATLMANPIGSTGGYTSLYAVGAAMRGRYGGGGRN